MADGKRMANMKKISEVQEMYTNDGPNAVDQDYRHLVEIIRRYQIDEPIPNSDYLHALYLNELMFNASRRTVRMLNGPSKDGWMKVLFASIEAMLKRIKNAGKGKVRAIIFGDEEPKTLTVLKRSYGDILKCLVIDSDVQLRHFIVCDSRMLRLEDLHDPLNIDMDTRCINAEVYLDNPVRAKAAEDYFDALWAGLGGK